MSAGTLTVLLIGDIVGRAGRCALDRALRQIVQRHRVDFVVANGENAAAGMGLTPTVAIELFDAGVDVLTSGNHIWGKKEMMPFLEE
ncbi:MAG: YmdB family metallophosphoesterase, partial [Deltaproteobacteria bacterium]|nr:YmdB family metallophosphoesterase [Deltaproteobacteria bacterium]